TFTFVEGFILRMPLLANLLITSEISLRRNCAIWETVAVSPRGCVASVFPDCDGGGAAKVGIGGTVADSCTVVADAECCPPGDGSGTVLEIADEGDNSVVELNGKRPVSGLKAEGALTDCCDFAGLERLDSVAGRGLGNVLGMALATVSANTSTLRV